MGLIAPFNFFNFFSPVSEVLTMSDDEFAAADAGSADTFPAQCSTVRKGGHVVIKDRPCKIIDMSTSKTGKHGHAKVHLIATDIFTGKKLEELCPSSHNMNVPIVKRTEYALIDISDEGFCSLLMDSGETKEDLKLPDDLANDIQKGFDDGAELVLTVQTAMGEEAIVSFKEAAKGN